MTDLATASTEPEVGQAPSSEYYRGLADLYRFYGSALFRELTEEQISILAETEFPDDSADEGEAQGYRWMRTYLARRGSDPRTDLAVDYARVFLAAGTYDGATAVPYESVYRSDSGILMQEPRDEVVLAYRAYGFAVEPDLQTPEDHAGFELEFMAILSDKIAGRLEAGEDPAADIAAQSAFIDEHILSWFPQLMERVDEWAELRFYPALMRIIVGTVRENRSANEELGR